MEQMFRLLFVGLLGGLWLSLEEANCQDVDKGISTTSHCYSTSSRKTCFTILLVNGSHPVRKPFKTASDWCNSTVPGSSLIVINNLERLRNAKSFLGRQGLANETIITDAQKLSSRDRTKWSWVNGYSTIPIDVSAEQLLDVACVELKHDQSLSYCTSVHTSQYSYICEYTESNSNFSYRQNNKSYVAGEKAATWYDARKECLRLGGDLAVITDPRTIEYWSWLKENQKYWIGLHRNKWIWNSTGAALTYTNWEDGHLDEASSDKQCVCIKPQCRENDTTICQYDRKWRSCNCNHDYAIVCQKEEETSDAVTREIDVIGEMSSSTSKDFKSSVSLSVNTTTSSHSSTPSSSASLSALSTAKSSSKSSKTSRKRSGSNTIPITLTTTTSTITITTFTTSSSTGLFESFSTKEILLTLVLFVAVVFIIVAVILIIRKRKYGRQNEISQTKNTNESETVSPVYATVVSVNRPSECTVPPGNPIYAEVEVTKQPTPPSSSTIYASVQPTTEAVDKGKNVVYADLDFPQKDQQKSRSADKITTSLSSSYSQPYKPPTSASNALHAEPIYLEAIDVDPTATQDPSALYAEPMKLKTSS